MSNINSNGNDTKAKKKIPFFLVLFLMLVIILNIASLIRKDADYSFLENRTLAYFQWPTAENFMSGDWFNNFETYCLDQVIGRDKFIITNSRIQRLMGKKEVNGVVVGKNGCLLDTQRDYFPEDESDENTQGMLDTLNLVKTYTDSYGGELYYVDIYPRYCYFQDNYIYPQQGYVDEADAQREKRLKTFEAAGIKTVDASQDYKNHPDEALYYYTDVHYSFKGAYYVYQRFLEAFRANEADKIDVSAFTYPEWEDMELVSFDNPFEGSYSHMIGDTVYEYNDKLEYAIPDDYPTEYTRYEDGELSDLPIFRNVRDDGYTEYNFMDGIRCETVIDTGRDELPSILIVSNSFAQAFEVMAIYNFNEMHMLSYNGYQGSICKYIREKQPDYVVILGNRNYDGNMPNEGLTFHE